MQMQTQVDYWYVVLRTVILGSSLFVSILILAIIIIQKLYSYIYCQYVFALTLSQAIIMASALLITNHSIDKYQKNKFQCLVQAFLIHWFRMVTIFISFLMMHSIKKIIKFQGQEIRDRYKKLLVACFIIPMIINALPFAYKGFGSGGFYVVNSNGLTVKYDCFCFWNQNWDTKNTKQVYLNFLQFFFNYAFPNLIIIVLIIVDYCKIISQKNKIGDVAFSRQEKQIIKLLGYSFIAVVNLIANMVLRSVFMFINNDNSELPNSVIIILSVVNYSYDIIPIINGAIFMKFIRRCTHLKYLKFLSRKKSQQQQNLNQTLEF